MKWQIGAFFIGALFWLASAAAVASCTSQSEHGSKESSGAPVPTADSSPQQGPGSGRVDGPLAPRLRLLADLEMAGMLPSDPVEQNRLIGLSDEGGGSLSRDAAGQPIVDVRVTDTADTTLTELTAHGASILSVSREYATVTLSISVSRLNELAGLASVQYVTEVIRPFSGR